MAKWGEGDPRWIVEERPDATNVNNWHWSEKDASKWSTTRLTELLKDVVVEVAGKRLRVNEVDKVSGEAFVNNRKAKLIFLYDWRITGKWDGVFIDDDGTLISGEFEIVGLSDENDVDEVDVVVSTSDTSDVGDDFKNAMRLAGAASIKENLKRYITELKSQFSKGLLKPVSDKNGVTGINGTVPDVMVKKKMDEAIRSSPPASSSSKVQSFTTVSLREAFKCDAQQLYDFFTLKPMIQAWSRAGVEWELKRDVPFSLFDGGVSGVVLDFVRGASLKLRWRLSSWPEAHFSEVKMTFDQREDDVELKLEQTGVPDSQSEATAEGWRRKTFAAIKATFGVGGCTL